MTEWCEVDEPKIWVSRFFTSRNLVNFDWSTRGARIDYKNAYWRDQALADPKDAPERIFFEDDTAVKPTLKDAFTIIGGILIISPALRDVLVECDLGQSQLFEVPICADESGTPSGLPNHYALNVHEPRRTVIIELSDNIERPISPGRTEPAPNAKYVPQRWTEILPVRADSAQGPDLWHDPRILSRFFMSDRLKQAIDAADLKVKGLDLYPARVFEEA